MLPRKMSLNADKCFISVPSGVIPQRSLSKTQESSSLQRERHAGGCFPKARWGKSVLLSSNSHKFENDKVIRWN